MLGIFVSAILICAAALLLGRALFVLLGRPDWTWLEPAVGLATLITTTHILISLPGPAWTAALLLALLLVGAGYILYRHQRGERTTTNLPEGTDSDIGPPRFAAERSSDERGADVGSRPLATAVVVLATVLLLSAIPFALNARTGVLGEGIYSNDHAVHLYWADWLQNEVGEKPKGIGWGYPVGPHAVVATTAEATGISIEDVFNGLLLAIPALTALTALAALGGLSPLRRIIAAVLVGMPFLAASFFAQSSFKETALALFVLAFALSLAALSREGPEPAARGPNPCRALVAGIVLLAIAAVLTFSVPGIVWFGLGLVVWIVVEAIAGRLPFSFASVGAGLRRAWPLLAIGTAIIVVLAIVEAGTISRFAERIREVQESQGRLSGRLPPWEVLGVWPRGDFRVGTGAVDGAAIAIGSSLLAAAVAAVWWVRRRQLAVPALVLTALAVFLVARVTSGIHVEAKALVVASPLVMLFIIRGLLEGKPRGWSAWRIAFGSLFAGLALLSTLLALRATPVGTPAHPDELAELQDEVAGKEVAFLSLDRFAPYRLSGAERVQSPGGYVPNALRGREDKTWGQSEPIDFDSLDSDVLDRFGYAVTTGAAYGSSAPENWGAFARTENFVLWKRNGKGPAREVLDAEDPGPGAVLPCGEPPATKAGSAGVWTTDPVLADNGPWRPSGELIAGETAKLELLLPAGTWQLSLQYNSEVTLQLRAEGLERELPAALDGFYSNGAGKGPFWPAGELETEGGTVEVRVEADDAPGLSRLVGAERRAWLGDFAAVQLDGEAQDPPGPREAKQVPLKQACGGYLDWYSAE
ncbi:MAG: hypothetical protein ACR2OC_02330 [Solirubrobacterales bacterium]